MNTIYERPGTIITERMKQRATKVIDKRGIVIKDRDGPTGVRASANELVKLRKGR